MAAQETQPPWDAPTDRLIAAIDSVNEAGGIDTKIRDVLMHPEDYITKPGAKQTIDDLLGSVDGYLKDVADNLKDEAKELEQALASLDLSFSKVDSVISEKTSSARVPYVKPYAIYYGSETREEVVVEKYTEDLDMLLGKLSNASDFVSDLSGEYKGHKLGSWLFSGKKDYIVTLKAPDSMIMDMDRGCSAIKGMLSAVLAGVNASQAA